MKKTNSRAKSPARRQPPRQTRDVASTILAVIVAVSAGTPWLTPLVLAAPLAFYLAKGAAGDSVARDALARRWSITIFATVMGAGALALPLALESVPFAADLPGRIDMWLEGGGGPVLAGRYMLAAGLATLVLTAASAGIAGSIVLASILALNAVSATLVISRGYNIIQMAIVAVSPWQWCFMAGLVALYTPISVLSRKHVLARDGAPFVWPQQRTRILVGGGLLILAFVLRFVLAGPYAALIRRWTFH